jgi:GAF domain-containing protein
MVEFVKQRGSFRAGAGTPLESVQRTKEVVNIADDAARPSPGAATIYGGARSLVAVPMLKDDALIGAFNVYRQEVRPFTDKQIALVQNFAAQAVIAIENARLLNELHQRTSDLSESLEQQTATSEVLHIISSSPGELEPVFKAMLANATRLCDAPFGGLFLRDGDFLRFAARHIPSSGASEAIFRWGPGFDLRENAIHPLARVVYTKEIVHIADLQMDTAYIERNPRVVALVELEGARTFLFLPMLKDNECVGAFGIFRQEIRPFTDRQIELVQNFAAQAVIAIENARLLNELRQRTTDLTESLEQQTATSNVLRRSTPSSAIPN